MAKPFLGGSSHQNILPVGHFIGHIPFASLEGDKRPDKINQNQESLNILCPKQENNVSIFKVPPLIKIICLFAAGLGGSQTYYNPRKLCLWWVYCFHVYTPRKLCGGYTVFTLSVRASVTFFFF